MTAVAADDGVDRGEAEGGQGSNVEVCFVFFLAFLHYVHTIYLDEASKI